MLRHLFVTLVGVAAVTGVANAASLEGMKGRVLVNSGQGFSSVDLFTPVKAGDQVLVGTDSQATLRFNNDCTLTISAGTIYQMTKNAPCAKGKFSAVVGGDVIAPAGGEYYGDGPPAADGPTIVPPPSAFLASEMLPLAAIAGAVVVGGVAFAVASDEDESPASAP